MDDALCLSIIMPDRTLDLQACSPAERDSWFWLLKVVKDKIKMGFKGNESPHVLSEENFQSILFLINTCFKVC